jgi:AraC-like DNA-binding protein
MTPTMAVNAAPPRADSSLSFQVHAELGIEQISARFHRQRFAPHAHDDYLIGVTTEGAESLVQRGQRLVSCAGHLRLINPGEVHEGGPADGLWAYQAFYVWPKRLGEMLDLPNSDSALPAFASAIAQDSVAVCEMLSLHKLLRVSSDAHERETAAMLGLARVFRRHAITSPGGAALRRDQRAVQLVADCIRDRFADKLTLSDLSKVAGLSRFHLLRQFKAAIGLTPWQFQTQLRVDAARKLLRAGERAGHVAPTCGFVDQSHFTRVFRQTAGMTPGVYAAGYAQGQGDG